MKRETRIPIFPLGTVLFPDGVLPLRIFETRYMDMIRDCLRDDSEFGVCLITEGVETGKPAQHEALGCTARITHWDMEQLGLLNIRTTGVRRFRIIEGEMKPDGLKMASVKYLDPEPDAPIPDVYQPCIALLERVVQDLIDKEADPMRRMIQEPCEYGSASWVSNRLCEFLPIAAQSKHELMALNDPLSRLGLIHEYLSKQQVL